MGQTGKKNRPQGEGQIPPGPATLTQHPASVASPTAKAMGHPSGKRSSPPGPTPRRLWLADKRPVLRFVLVFGLLLGGFNLFFYLWFSKGEAFEAYLRLNARWSAAVITLLGDQATTNGTAITASRYQLDIRRGCDAIQASAFFVLGVLSSPSRVPLLWRLPPIVLGTVFLLVLNLVRIVSLYYTGVYFPRAFEVMHVDVWQALFIFFPLFLWVAWARWVARGEAGTADVPT